MDDLQTGCVKLQTGNKLLVWRGAGCVNLSLETQISQILALWLGKTYPTPLETQSLETCTLTQNPPFQLDTLPQETFYLKTHQHNRPPLTKHVCQPTLQAPPPTLKNPTRYLVTKKKAMRIHTCPLRDMPRFLSHFLVTSNLPTSLSWTFQSLKKM